MLKQNWGFVWDIQNKVPGCYCNIWIFLKNFVSDEFQGMEH